MEDTFAETLTSPVAAIPIDTLSVAPRIEAVDGLRGFAALIVVVYHTFDVSGAPEWRPVHGVNLLRPLHDGWAGVNLFLVLSGFCLYWPFVTRPDRPFRTLSYAIRRVWRIVPTYYLSLAFISLSALLWPTFRAVQFDAFPLGWKDFLLHLSLLHSLTGATIRSWNSVTWSLGLEWTWYMVFPLAMWLYVKVGANRGFVCLAAVTLVYRGLLYVLLERVPMTVMDGLAWRTFVLGRLFEFGIGMWVAWRVNQPMGSVRWLHWAPLGTLLLLILSFLAMPIPAFLPVRDILYGSASAVLLLAATSPTDNFTRRFFSMRWICWVGLFSYSLYLFHLPMLEMVKILCRPTGLTGATLFFFMLPFSGVVVLICWLVFQFAERPFLRAKSALVKRALA